MIDNIPTSSQRKEEAMQQLELMFSSHEIKKAIWEQKQFQAYVPRRDTMGMERTLVNSGTHSGNQSFLSNFFGHRSEILTQNGRQYVIQNGIQYRTNTNEPVIKVLGLISIIIGLIVAMSILNAAGSEPLTAAGIGIVAITLAIFGGALVCSWVRL